MSNWHENIRLRIVQTCKIQVKYKADELTVLHLLLQIESEWYECTRNINKSIQN